MAPPAAPSPAPTTPAISPGFATRHTRSPVDAEHSTAGAVATGTGRTTAGVAVAAGTGRGAAPRGDVAAARVTRGSGALAGASGDILASPVDPAAGRIRYAVVAPVVNAVPVTSAMAMLAIFQGFMTSSCRLVRRRGSCSYSGGQEEGTGSGDLDETTATEAPAPR